jgi:hypothetical protein
VALPASALAAGDLSLNAVAGWANILALRSLPVARRDPGQLDLWYRRGGLDDRLWRDGRRPRIPMRTVSTREIYFTFVVVPARQRGRAGSRCE